MKDEFLYHLRDTVILLGLDKKFADLLVDPGAIDEKEVEELQKYNAKLLNATKERLVSINKLAIDPFGER